MLSNKLFYNNQTITIAIMKACFEGREPEQRHNGVTYKVKYQPGLGWFVTKDAFGGLGIDPVQRWLNHIAGWLNAVGVQPVQQAHVDAYLTNVQQAHVDASEGYW